MRMMVSVPEHWKPTRFLPIQFIKCYLFDRLRLKAGRGLGAVLGMGDGEVVNKVDTALLHGADI